MHTKPRVILYAPSVHQGGGFVLLKSILSALNVKYDYAILDARLPLEVKSLLSISNYFAAKGLFGRLLAEWHLAKVATKNDVILCFGNLPPLFKTTSTNMVLFIQNKYLLCPELVNDFSFFRYIQKVLLKYRAKYIKQFIVQTPSMAFALKKFLKKNINIMTLALVGDVAAYSRCLPQEKNTKNKKYDFVYIASGEPHKNHYKLIEAWILLAEQGFYPALALTLSNDKFFSLVQHCNQQQQKYALKITNLGEVAHSQALELYKNAQALIYPSTLESFGLPLVEARQHGLAIVAAELNYVRDLVDPEQSFDPTSALSISRAVKRFLSYPENAVRLVTAQEFLNKIIFAKEF